MGLVPGNRVLLRSANNPMLAACWIAVMKAGGVAVTTMPLLRANELRVIGEKSRVSHALCDARLAAEMETAIGELGPASGRGTLLILGGIDFDARPAGGATLDDHTRASSAAKARSRRAQ